MKNYQNHQQIKPIIYEFALSHRKDAAMRNHDVFMPKM
jgi:hypothetical protein